MSNYGNFIETVNGLLLDAKSRKVINLDVTSLESNTNNIIVNNKELVSFGSCSYMGLEFDERMKKGAIDAIEKYGTQFSSSRAYLSVGLYEEYEYLLGEIFGSNAIVTPTTSLAHIAAIPNQVGDKDAVIMDHQVHTSVQVAVNLLKPRRIHVELVRHNNMEKLEERIIELSKTYDKVWYMADGVYSMYGDTLKSDDLKLFLNKYEKFHLYVDDAHGMSIAGKHGRGLTLEKMDLHSKMILSTSFAKGFATGGGVLIFPDKKQIDITRNCASPLVTSGPLQPAVLGAGVASAKIHLTNEIYELQSDLMDNIKYTNLLLQKSTLPAVFNSQTPIFFVGTSVPKVAYNIISKMKKDGHYLNLGMFPAVPMKNTGVRFTITRLHTFSQIEQMVKDLEKNYHMALIEENVDEKKIYQAFNLQPKEQDLAQTIAKKIEIEHTLTTSHNTSILNVDKEEWNSCFGGVGSFNWEGLSLLENTFKGNKEDYNNWDFDYFTIKNKQGEIILSTFFTSALSKDDMFAPEETSRFIEQKRKNNPNYLVSRTLFMGSLFTEGNHLYLNTKIPNWQSALEILFDKIDELKTKYQAENVVLRDFENLSEEINTLFIDNGYYKMETLNSNTFSNFNWNSQEEYLNTLTKKGRKNVRQEILRFSSNFEVNVYDGSSAIEAEKITQWYNLYLNVKQNNTKINTFDLPYHLLCNMISDKNWEVVELLDKNTNKIAAVVFSNKNQDAYSPMLIGLDYDINKESKAYKQMLFQLINRAKELNMNQIKFGFSADLEKRKVGAKTVKSFAYLCTDSSFNQNVIANFHTLQSKGVLI